MRAQLIGARRQLQRCGWVGPDKEPWCRDSRGRRVHHSDEGVYLFSLCGALQLGGPLKPALELLGRVVSPALAALRDFENARTYEELAAIRWNDGRDLFRQPEDGPGEFQQLEEQWWQLQVRALDEHLTFGGWLTERSRTREDVLRVLNTAVMRSPKEVS